ncbi:MAG: PspC domain-containing protein, partial [Planctomycetes bacterium]|nr:PspC domain-containing protein [Planctomycetota bacterium]
YFNIDPTIVRILFAASFFVGGVGLIGYIVCWIVIPEGEYGSGSASPAYSSGSGGAVAGLIAGAVIVFIGLGLLLDNLNSYYMPRWMRGIYSFDTFFGLALIGVGAFVVFHMLKKKDEVIPVAQAGSAPKAKTKAKDTGTSTPPLRQSTLYRSRTDRKVSGVCGGLGEYFNIDPTIVRIAMVVFIFASSIFPGLIIYFIMAVVIPETPMIQEDAV